MLFLNEIIFILTYSCERITKILPYATGNSRTVVNRKILLKTACFS